MTTDEQYAQVEQIARKLGAENGKNAAEWFEQYNTGGRVTRSGQEREWAETIIRMDDEGDPELFDSIPYCDLSGEWADVPSGPNVLETIAAEAGVELDHMDDPNELLDAYEEAYNDAAHDEIIRQARDYLAEATS